MRLYLVQHGASASEAEDPRRPLNEAGRRNVQKLAAHIAGFSLDIDVIEHSDKLRAIQTAEALALELRPALGARQGEGLAPNDPVGPTVERLRAERKGVMLVGHLPHLNSLANTLLGLRPGEAVLRFQMGGCLCLERDDQGRWAVCWMLTPDLLPEEKGDAHPSGDWAQGH
jgi:phosphohistidine phosphatase